jgi:parallel beta-helix repeat protein
MFKRILKPLLALATVAFVCQTAFAAPGERAAQSVAAPSGIEVSGLLESDAIWSGDVLVTKTVIVPVGIKLLIEAGARVRFSPTARLDVNGELEIDGSKERPVWLGPEEEPTAQDSPKALWPGLRIINAKLGRIGHARFVGAGWSEIVGTSLNVRNTVFEKGLGGLKFTTGGTSLVTESTFAQLAQGGVNVSTGAAVEVFDSTFSQCGDFGVVNGQRGLVRVKGCEFESCKLGVKVMNDGSGIKENSFKNCEVAIAVLQSSGNLVIWNNRISGGDIGILCNQFASPKVLGNEINGAREGIRCFQGSSPLLAHNRIEGCETAISCVQLCKPLIEKNQLFRNKVGIYLQASSYAVIRNNNFESNALHLELGDMMSADWENRVASKNPRGRQARNQELVKMGRAVPEKLVTKVATSGEVSASSNWWGEATTAEMVEKGQNAGIAGFKDSFDTPKVSYKGYEGEYALDRISYADWLNAPVGDAGPEGFKPPEKAQPPATDSAPSE